MHPDHVTLVVYLENKQDGIDNGTTTHKNVDNTNSNIFIMNMNNKGSGR